MQPDGSYIRAPFAEGDTPVNLQNDLSFGVANYTREGTDVTIIALAAMVHKANRWWTNWRLKDLWR